METIDQFNMHLYPNALAKLKVSVKDLSIANIGTIVQERPTMANKKANKKTVDSQELDLIWKNLGIGKIDISYACVGYTIDGKPVLNQDELISLLINYGFTMPTIMAFIDDFALHSKQDDNAPVIMYTVNTAKIMTEVKPIVKKK